MLLTRPRLLVTLSSKIIGVSASQTFWIWICKIPHHKYTKRSEVEFSQESVTRLWQSCISHYHQKFVENLIDSPCLSRVSDVNKTYISSLAKNYFKQLVSKKYLNERKFIVSKQNLKVSHKSLSLLYQCCKHATFCITLLKRLNKIGLLWNNAFDEKLILC